MEKKIIAVLLCLATLFCVIAVPSSSLKYDDGMDALRTQWHDGEGPVIDGFNIDYSYFVPETDKPCPLMVFMGGVGNGTYEGKELTVTDFPYWSSEEFQANTENAEGMYLMILRSPLPFYFDTCPLTPMYEAIRDFADTHNVDKKRICLFGRCLGASGVNRLASTYPEYFSGACYLCPRTIISPEAAQKMRNMKVWIFNSYLDTYSIFPFFALPSWIIERIYNSDKSNIRLTSCLFAPNNKYVLNHDVYQLVFKNFSHGVEGDYIGLNTVDGYGRTVTDLDVIKFFTSGPYTPASDLPATPTDVTPTDATPSDATPTDATPSDATPTEPVSPTDATPTDATPSDATPTDPASPTDAATTDPASQTDATPSDTASPTDAGTPSDSGTPSEPGTSTEAGTSSEP